MAYTNAYRAIGTRIDRNMKGHWLQYQRCETPQEAEAEASRLSEEVRRKRRELGLTRPHTGAYGQSYPESRTRPEVPVTQEARNTAAAQAKVIAPHLSVETVLAAVEVEDPEALEEEHAPKSRKRKGYQKVRDQAQAASKEG